MRRAARRMMGRGESGENYHLFGDRYLEVPNEPEALVINYHLRGDISGQAHIRLADLTGRVLREVQGPARTGLNRALVNLAGSGRGRVAGGGAGAGAPGQRARGIGAAQTGSLAVGEYVVTVEVAGETLTKPARVRDRI